MRLMDKVLFGRALDYAQDVIEELEREAADVVVSSEMLPGVIAACESRGQRQVMLSANLCFLPFPGMPAFGPGLPPPRTAEERQLHDQIIAGTTQMFDAGLGHLNQARAALGLPPLARSVDQFFVPSMFLLATSRAFDWPVQPPGTIRYVGAQLDEPGWVEEWQSPWPKDDARPLVTIGFSTSFQDHAAALQRVINASGELPVCALVTLGQIQPDEVQASANTAIVRSAPTQRRDATGQRGGHAWRTWHCDARPEASPADADHSARSRSRRERGPCRRARSRSSIGSDGHSGRDRGRAATTDHGACFCASSPAPWQCHRQGR